jgi:phosphoglycolate phosphatase-like HAD superfamily hydrolase
VTLPELVVFDLAGTTVEDRGQVPDAFEAALAAHGLAVSHEQIGDVRGSSKRTAIASFVPAGADHSARVLWNVGVLSGAHTRARLETAPHTHLLDSVAALPGLFGDAR